MWPVPREFLNELLRAFQYVLQGLPIRPSLLFILHFFGNLIYILVLTKEPVLGLCVKIRPEEVCSGKSKPSFSIVIHVILAPQQVTELT